MGIGRGLLRLLEGFGAELEEDLRGDLVGDVGGETLELRPVPGPGLPKLFCLITTLWLGPCRF